MNRESGNKKAMVCENLKRRIINCELVPGTPIVEADVAAELGVSKTPVREALRHLERDGFVESIPGRGSTVSHITLVDIREIIELREIMETGAARRAAVVGRGDKVLAQKSAELRQLLMDEPASEETVYEWGEWEDVHLAIVRSLGNRTFLSMYESLLDRIKRVRNHFGRRFTQRRFHEIMSEHLEILEEIIEGDPDGSEEAVKRHLQKASDFLEVLSGGRKE